MAKAYLAVPITDNRELRKARRIASVLREFGFKLISRWVVEENPGFDLPPSEVFERDIGAVGECDVLVAEVSRRSHGVGMEVMLAHVLGKPIVCMYERRARVSRMLLGLPGAVLVEYASERDMADKLRLALAALTAE